MDDFQRKLPYSSEAEQAVLGSVFIDPESFAQLLVILSEGDFYLSEHRAIFAAMQEMFVKSKRIDVVTLLQQLTESGVCDKAGGINYLKALANSTRSAANIRDYAGIIRDKAIRRKLIEACGEISDTAFSGEGRIQDVVGAAEQKIYDISANKSGEDFRRLDEIFGDVFGHLEKLGSDKAGEGGLKTGFEGVDRVLLGLGKGDLVLIGARPGMGKTSFALNIATNVARQTKKTVCIFSLEMSAEQLALRILSSEALVNNTALRSGDLTEADWDKLTMAVEKLEGTNILVDDTAGITISQMKAKVRRLRDHDLGLVVIDYLQLMQSDKKFDSRVNEVSDISRNLKLMAKDFGVPVICCAQLSRNPENRKASEGGRRPMLSDLRESGSIEQDADMVLMLYCDDYYDLTKEEREMTRLFEIIVAKNRHGETKTVKIGWVPQYTKFRSLMPEDEKHFKDQKADES